MNTSGEQQDVAIRLVRFEGEMLLVELSDEHLIGLPFTKVKWLDWLSARPYRPCRFPLQSN